MPMCVWILGFRIAWVVGFSQVGDDLEHAEDAQAPPVLSRGFRHADVRLVCGFQYMGDDLEHAEDAQAPPVF